MNFFDATLVEEQDTKKLFIDGGSFRGPKLYWMARAKSHMPTPAAVRIMRRMKKGRKTTHTVARCRNKVS
jgi:hypothetical protein